MNRLAFDMEGEPYIDDHGEFVTYDDHRDALHERREADAALVEAAGCLQEEGCQVWDPQPGHGYRWAEIPSEHHEQCPIALAAKIRRQP